MWSTEGILGGGKKRGIAKEKAAAFCSVVDIPLHRTRK